MTTQINKPEVTLDLLEAPAIITNLAQKVLMVGQKLPIGTAVSGDIIENFQLGEEDTILGQASHLSAMVRAFKFVNKETQLDIIPLDENGGDTQFTVDVTFVGVVTRSGSIELVTGGAFADTNTVSVIIGDTANDIASKFEALINANGDSLVSSSVSVGVLTLTAEMKGEVGNEIGVKATIKFVEGITVTVETPTLATGNPSTTGLFDNVGKVRYQTVVYPTPYPLTTLTAFLDPRFNVTNNVLNGVGILWKTDTFANLLAIVNPLNNQNIVIGANQVINTSLYKGGDILELQDVITSIYAGIRSLRLTTGASLSAILPAGTQALDQRGGVAAASLPYFNTLLPRLFPGDVNNGFTDGEENDLKNGGATVIGVNRANNAIISGEAVTTRKTDNLGNPVQSWKFLNFLDTHSGVREFMVNSIKIRFAQSRLTSGSVRPGRNEINLGSIRVAFVEFYQTLGSDEFMLVDAGQASVDFFGENLVLKVDFALGEVTADMEVIITTQLRSFVGTIQIAFSTLPSL